MAQDRPPKAGLHRVRPTGSPGHDGRARKPGRRLAISNTDNASCLHEHLHEFGSFHSNETIHAAKASHDKKSSAAAYTSASGHFSPPQVVSARSEA